MQRARSCRDSGVLVVTPSWAESCRIERRRVPEGDFLAALDGDLPPAKKMRKQNEPFMRHLRSPGDPFFSSSQRDDHPGPSKRPPALAPLDEEALIESNDEKSGGGADEAAPKKELWSSSLFSADSHPPPRMTIGLSGLNHEQRDVVEACVGALKSRVPGAQLFLVTSSEPWAALTHLVVPAIGAKRTLKVLFALLQGTRIVTPSFFSFALDGVLPDERRFSVPGRDYWAVKQRAVLLNVTVWIDPKLEDPPRVAMEKIVALAGGKVVGSARASSVVLAAPTGASPLPPRDGGPRYLCPAELFDLIENGQPL